MRAWVVVIVALLAAAWLPTDAAKLGKIIYVKTVGDQSDAPADVWEKDLDTGKTSLLVSHKALPRGFETRVLDASLSPSGRYLYVAECSGVVTTSGRQYGSVFGFVDGEEKTAKWIGSAHWCWDRKVGRWARIAEGGSISIAHVTWAATKDLLLIQHEYDGSRLYNASTEKSRRYPSDEELHWSGTSGGLVSVIQGSGKKPCSVGIRSPDGSRKALFTWPAIWAISQSARGTFAIFDGRAFALVDSKGKRLARLKIPVEEDGFRADFCFNRSGSRLLVSTSHSYGEPALNLDEATWVVDTKTMTARELAETGGAFGFSVEDEVGLFDVLGWLPEDRTVVLAEATAPGISYGSESQGHSYSVSFYDVTGGTKPRKVFDTGTSCIAISWWLAPSLSAQLN